MHVMGASSTDDVRRDGSTRIPRVYGVRTGEPRWFSVLRVSERHLGFIVGALVFPLNWPLFWLFVVSYALRMWAIEGVYHRYFSHRAYKAGRAVQLALALLGLQTGQRGPLWWASKHRDHHKYADSAADPHSPRAHSFAHAYLTWFGMPEHAACDLDKVADYARFPELRWLDRFYVIPFYSGALLLFLAGHLGWLGAQIGGLSALVWGFYAPCLLVIHATSLVNTLGHLPRRFGGYRRFACADYSANRPLLALLTLGAGWHNNHHRYAASARAGFAWYELDPSYGLLRLLAALHVIRDVKARIPEEILREGNVEAFRHSVMRLRRAM